MNIFKFLHGKAGKVVFGAAQLGGTVVAAGLMSYAAVTVMGPSTNPQKNEMVRSITAIKNVNQATGSAINVAGGGFATAEQRAAIEGYSASNPAIAYRGAGGSRARGTDFDAAEERVGNLSLTASVTSSTEGLGLGENAAAETRSGGAPAGNIASTVQGRTAANNLAATTQAASGQQGNKLASATMARSSGGQGGTSGSYTAGGGSSSGTKSASAASSERANTINPSFSGTMPGGSTTLISKATFGAQNLGDSRDSTTDPRYRSAKEQNELKDIRKRSADAATNENRASNEGARAFLANNQQSGGIRTEDGNFEGLGGGTSADFETPYMARSKAAEQAADDELQTQAKRDNHRARIMRNMMALIGLTIIGMFSISALMKGGIWSKIAAVAIGVVLLAAIAFFIADAAKYKNAYDNYKGVGSGGIIIGSILAAMVGASFLAPVQKLCNNIMAWMGKVFGLSPGGLAVGGLGSAKTVAQDTMASINDSGEDTTGTSE